ncbi:MAG: hypothetical protein GXO16_09255 [Epsilonproteobacteria bacterium]|nr:hypothetical protein [Campylobacterota bacterium]
MKTILDFEQIADHYSAKINGHNPAVSSISRCDKVIMQNDRILLIEETRYKKKDLTDFRLYSREVIENVKKMWGSFAILIASQNLSTIQGKDRYYILLIDKLDSRNARALANLIKVLHRYCNGAITTIKFKERQFDRIHP